MKQAIYVGVDVSKKQLDVAIRPLGQVFGVSNDRRGIAQLVKRLKKLQPVCIAIDATGGLEKELAYALATENLPVAVVNPRQVSNFAKSTGQRAKTDAIDAAVLAHFAEVMKPEVRPLMPDRRVGRPEPLSRCRCARQLRRCGAASAAIGQTRVLRRARRSARKCAPASSAVDADIGRCPEKPVVARALRPPVGCGQATEGRDRGLYAKVARRDLQRRAQPAPFCASLGHGWT